MPLLRFFWVWLVIGLQSFGGGMATFALVRRAAIEQYGWYTEEEFTRAWGLCQMAPGINLVCIVILIGQRVRGVRGVAVALAGMLVPSAILTVALTATFARYAHSPILTGALRGVMPATIGLGLLTSAQMLRPLVRAARRGGWLEVTLAAAIVLGSAAAIGLLNVPVVYVLVAFGLLGGTLSWAKHAVAVDAEAGES